MDRIRIRPAAFTAAAGRLATLLLPHQCVLCRQFADTTGLCATCWDGLTPIAAPLCARCGLPLGHTLADPLCAGCWTKPPPLAAIRACFHYADSARELILHYKHGDGLQLTPLLARLGARLFIGTWQPGDAGHPGTCLLYTSPSPRDKRQSRMPSSA